MVNPLKHERRMRIKKLENLLNKKSKGKTYAEVISGFMLDESVSLRKVREYLKILRLNGKISKDATI